MNRLITFFLAAILAVGLSACGGSGGGVAGGGSGGTSALSSISGTVLGYPYNSSAIIQGFAIEDGAQLASGTLNRAGTSTSFSANFTAIDLVPSSAYVNPFFCNNAVVTPSSAMTTGLFIVRVADTGGVFGELLNTTMAPNAVSATTSDRLYVYILADRATTITGNCADGVSTTFDMNLRRGWNRVEGTFTLIDGFGAPIAVTWRATESTLNNNWVFQNFGTMSTNSTTSRLATAVDKLLRLSFNID